MVKISFLLAALCGLVSLNLSFAEQTTDGGMPAPAKYEAPSMEDKYPMKPEYKKIEDKEQKYEAPAMYEEKKDEYPMKPEYKKMENGGKKMYKRSADDETEETTNDDQKVTKVKANIVSIQKVNQLRDAVMKDILADPILGLGFRYRRYPYFGSGYRRYSPYFGSGYRRYPYFGSGYRRYSPYFGSSFRRFGYYPSFFDPSRKVPAIPEQGSTSADAAGLDSENDDDSEELDAIATPQRKWWNDVDEDQFMDAEPQGRWWSPEELDEATDLLPARRACSIRNGRRICLAGRT